MLIFITGGSNAALLGGWADNFVTKISRKHLVQNMALGATHSATAMIRVKYEAPLSDGDVVVWSNATNDALCLKNGAYQDGSLLGYTEEIIRHCHAVGARFIPVIIDTFDGLVAIQQSGYKDELLALFAHYGLKWVDVAQAFTEDTGMARMPRHLFADPTHIAPGSPLNDFIADLAVAALDQGFGTVKEATPILVNPTHRYAVVDEFSPDSSVTVFSNRFVDVPVWMPPLAAKPVVPDGFAATEVETIVVLADGSAGAFTLRSGAQSLSFSVTHAFPRHRKPMILAVSPRDMVPEGFFVDPEDGFTLDWCCDGAGVHASAYFRENPAAHFSKPLGSQARLVSILLRHHPA